MFYCTVHYITLHYLYAICEHISAAVIGYHHVAEGRKGEREREGVVNTKGCREKKNIISHYSRIEKKSWKAE